MTKVSTGAPFCAQLLYKRLFSLNSFSIKNAARLFTIALLIAGTVFVSQASAAIALNPTTASVRPGATAQFHYSADSSTNLTGAQISWMVWPQIGSINSSGLYTAPSSVSVSTSVKVVLLVVPASSTQAPQVAYAAVTIQPAVGISVSPATATLSAYQTKQFSATIANSSNTAVNWSVSPAVGTISSYGLYTAPQTVASQQTVTVTAQSLADPTKNASATITLQPAASANVLLPMEIMGRAGTSKTAQVTIPSDPGLSGTVTLTAQIHGLEYETQGSVRINGGSWIALTSPAVQGLGAQYGAIGGGFSTLQFAIPLPAGLVTAGTNTISFMFNGSDGNSSGYRVLAFNLQTSAGTQLIASSTFVQDDPSTWTAPLNDAASIAAGQNLWRTAPLMTPIVGGGMRSIQAHCGDCHTQDGRDLKYFNYSNNAIHARAVFHGLNATQADQIASYIRSLQTPAPSQARPWNPPYQPGAGMDSKPVAEWSAGAGLGAVLSSDAGMEPYLAPGGVTTNWAANQYLNIRELPVALQLPDWNHWLPRVHPMDAWGSNFTTSSYNTQYTKLRSDLTPNDANSYANSVNNQDYVNWFIAQDNFLVPIESATTNWDANDMRNKVYATALWQMVKLWEINQEFGLEGMPQAAFGSQAEARAWYGNRSFHASPNMLHIPYGTGLGNGSLLARTYLSYIWYHEQLVLNDGNGQEHGQDPVDYPYVFGFTKDLSLNSNGSPEAMLHLMWLVKGLQEETENGVGPEQGSSGWQPTYTDPSSLMNSAWSTIWSATSMSTRNTLTQGYLNAWLSKVSSFTPQQFYQGGWANASDNPATLDGNVTFGGAIWYMLPRFRYNGVDPNLTYQIADWAATVWPNGNWSLNKSATCNAAMQCTSDPQ